jgi:demethylmenaquinone methyltransferase/2-methoxy-6-polyprenyl-1,4-benzoquinol methylase
MNAPNETERAYYELTERFFRRLAPFYDCFVSLVSRLRVRVVALTDAAPGSKVLDVATGTGKQAFAFARAGYSVQGVDLSRDMLAVALRKNRYPNASFEIGDATKLRFEKASFDVTTVSFALHDMPLSIRARVVAEMVRVTVPEGRFVIVDYDLPKNPLWSWVVFHFIILYEGEYYREFIRSDLEALLRKSGITITARQTVLFGAARILIGVKGAE